MPRPRRGSLPKYDGAWFALAVAQAFDFLVSDYGFTSAGLKSVAYEANVKYIKPHIQVAIIWIHGGVPELRVVAKMHGQSVSKSLTELSGMNLTAEYPVIPRRIPDPESADYASLVVNYLATDAKLLKKYCMYMLID